MKRISVGTALLLIMCCSSLEPKESTHPSTPSPAKGEETDQIDQTVKPMQDIMGTGTIRFIDLEGGFYGIVADDGQRFDAGTLGESFQQDGLRVRFTVRERTGVMSIRMWGRIVEVVSLTTL